MSLMRVVAVVLVLSAGAAAIVAFVSRTPASVRLADGDASDDDGTDAAAGFTEAQVARHGAYRGPLYLGLAFGLLIQIVFLVLLRGAPITWVAGWAERVPGGWAVTAALVGAAIALVAWLIALPLAFVRGHALQKAWGLSTQDVAGWLSDQGKVVGVSLVIAALATVAFFAIVRWQPRSWWLWVAAAFAALNALMVFLFPVAIAPLFNRFVPLEDPTLVSRIEEIAADAGVPIDEVLVADASRRSTAENAYVAGLGATKRMVLYDTLLERGRDDETMFVVAHELGHEVEDHVLKNVALSAVGILVAAAALAWIVSHTAFLRFAGATGIADVRVLPALLLFVTFAGIVTAPVENAVSRSFERTADRIAFDLTGDPDPVVRAFRRLALANIADLTPPPVAVWLLYSHPPIPERIAAARAHNAAKQ